MRKAERSREGLFQPFFPSLFLKVLDCFEHIEILSLHIPGRKPEGCAALS